MESVGKITVAGAVLAIGLVSVAIAETKKEFRYTVNPNEKTVITVDAQYGAITVKPGSALNVAVVAIVQDKASVDHLQKGNRIELESHAAKDTDSSTGRVDYELTVPPTATLNLRSSNGPIVIEHLKGDLTLEGATAPVEVRNSGWAHVHIKTMNGPITLTEVRNAHIEVTSIGGDIHLSSVSGPFVQVNSGTGKIFYDGDFGQGGDYDFSTHTGDIEALVPANASVDFNAHSLRGQVQSDISLAQNEHPKFPVEAGRSFFGSVGKAASEVVFKSISGKILLKRR